MAATDATFSGTDPNIDPAGDDLRSLVDAARDGDREAFDELVRRTWSTTHTLAFRLTGDDDDAREVCQETYLRAYRGIRRFRGDARFTTWLHRITVNCASSHLGRRRRHRHERLDTLDGDEPIAELIDSVPAHDPVGRAEHADLRDRVRTALSQLPPKLRAVVVLRDIYDLTHEEIAAELGISISAAKVRLHRARRRLRDGLFLADTDAMGEGPSSRTAASAVAASIQGRRRRSKGGGDVDPRPL